MSKLHDLDPQDHCLFLYPSTTKSKKDLLFPARWTATTIKTHRALVLWLHLVATPRRVQRVGCGVSGVRLVRLASFGLNLEPPGSGSSREVPMENPDEPSITVLSSVEKQETAPSRLLQSSSTSSPFTLKRI